MMKSVLLLFLSLATRVSGSPDEADRVRVVIERHNANAVRWYATGDVDSLVGICAEDAWQMPPNHPALVGRNAIRAYWRQAVKWGKWDFTLQTQQIAASGPMAVERGKYVLKFTAGPAAPPGMASFEDHGNYLVHWRREVDGQWRVVADAPVSEVPMQPPPSPAAP
jgi:ketosteroid isomerase-like protein